LNIEPNPDGVWIHCPNPACDYVWRYSGRFFLYATCPSCRRNVKISENKVEKPKSLQSVQVRGQSQTVALVKDTPSPDKGDDASRL
jgi:hypothetical protein